jgi:hypothetical protein
MALQLLTEAKVGQALMVALDAVDLLEVAKLAPWAAATQAPLFAESPYLFITRASRWHIGMDKVVVFAPMAQAD